MSKEINRNCKRKEIMENDFVRYEQALDLKELGFDKSCFAKYFQQDGSDGFLQIGETEIEEAESAGSDVTFECDAPLYQQAFRWFREKYNIWNWVERYTESDFYIFQIPSANLKKVQGYYKTYEEAELECLKKLIEIVKEKK